MAAEDETGRPNVLYIMADDHAATNPFKKAMCWTSRSRISASKAMASPASVLDSS